MFHVENSLFWLKDWATELFYIVAHFTLDLEVIMQNYNMPSHSISAIALVLALTFSLAHALVF